VEPLETRTLLSHSPVVHALSFPSDPLYTRGYQWDMNGGYGSNASAAWNAGYTGLDRPAVYVGVVDEGIQYNHPDLAGHVGNPAGTSGDTYGWDFYYNDNNIYHGGKRGTQDDHGTHVAGTIGAVGNNGKGIAGIDWNTQIIDSQFLGPNGTGTDDNAVKAINYLVNLKVNQGVNIVAINASWGGTTDYQPLHDAIAAAGQANILVVAAAGNSGANNDTSSFYPTNYATSLPNVISVAALDQNGNLPSWSNYGAQSVDLAAPGVNIVSTVPYNGYAAYSGTSMAAPHVTGAIALYAAYHPEATAAQIKEALLSSTDPTASLAGKTVTGGRLDVANFLNTAPTVVSAASGTKSTAVASRTGVKSTTNVTVVSQMPTDLALSLATSTNIVVTHATGLQLTPLQQAATVVLTQSATSRVEAHVGGDEQPDPVPAGAEQVPVPPTRRERQANEAPATAAGVMETPLTPLTSAVDLVMTRDYADGWQLPEVPAMVQTPAAEPAQALTVELALAGLTLALASGYESLLNRYKDDKRRTACEPLAV
jgi:subtilisin family serine protease